MSLNWTLSLNICHYINTLNNKGLLILFLIKFVSFVEFGNNLHCELWRVHAHMITTILVLLFVSGVVLNFMSYFHSKLNRNETPSPPTNSVETKTVEWIELTDVEMRF